MLEEHQYTRSASLKNLWTLNILNFIVHVVNLKGQIFRHPRSSYKKWLVVVIVSRGSQWKKPSFSSKKIRDMCVCVRPFLTLIYFNHPTNDLWIFTYFSEFWAQQKPSQNMFKPWTLQENNKQRCLVVTVVKYIEGKSYFNKNLLQATMESQWLLGQNEFFPQNHLPMSSRVQREFIKGVGKLLKSI